MHLLDRLPNGAVVVGSGLLVNGLAAYVFITVASRDLGPEEYSPVGMLWVLSFLLGPGFFLPLEQETARRIASQLGQGVVPVARTVGAIGGLGALVLLLALGAASPWLVDRIFDGESWLLVGLLLSLVGLGLAHLVKGVLAGAGRFGGYAAYLIGEGLGRLLVVVLVAEALSVGTGRFGLAIGLAPFIGVGVALSTQRGLAHPGPPVGIVNLSRDLGVLLVASVSTLLVLNISPLAVELLAGPEEGSEPGRFLNALLVARIPLFFFQAVTAGLLPELSALAGTGRHEALWRALRNLLTVVVLFAVVVVVVVGVGGPWVVEFAFGSEYVVTRQDMVLLGISSAGLMVVLALAQGLIACRSRGRMAMAWLAGLLVFPLAVSLNDDLFLRVEVALIATVAVTSAAMAVFLTERIRHGTRLATED
ncbi:MAG: hypothetical protein VX833_00870 [Actinomycetota bacterium]|nr:hypothetical protein [Actinomycetota bacterium]